jgi:hypothetical protein
MDDHELKLVDDLKQAAHEWTAAAKELSSYKSKVILNGTVLEPLSQTDLARFLEISKEEEFAKRKFHDVNLELWEYRQGKQK